jgi:glycosyltransferase involved in cell wall biosynthesis
MSRGDQVSIVIPTYNRAEFIKYAVNSALNQTYKNVEVIVIDDGSTDSTKEICLQYGDRIRYFYKQNEGMVVALNYGIKMMKGSWFKYLADDDLLSADEIQVLIEGTNDGKFHIICADYELIDEKGNTFGILANKHFNDYYELAALLWLERIAIFGTTLIHRSCFDIVGSFDPSYSTAFDYEWCLRACFLHNYLFHHFPKAMYKLRIHKQQASTIQKSNANLWVKQARKNIENQMIEKYPQRWSFFKSYLKKHDRVLGNGPYVKRIMRRIVPYGLRNYYRRFRNKILFSRYEVRCEYCKLVGKNTYLYFTPTTDYLVCQNCRVQYTGENLKTLIRQHN